MLTNIWSKKKGTSYYMGSESDEEEGLRIITKQLVIKPGPKIVKPVFILNQIIQSISSNHTDDFYLKSCHLCHKHLPLDKEIYMYMGDLGFCSVECRDRQIYLDEMKEIEASTRRVLESFRRRRRDGSGRCESGNVFEDFRQRRHRFSSEKNRVIFS